jgi:hypothetical protein
MRFRRIKMKRINMSKTILYLIKYKLSSIKSLTKMNLKKKEIKLFTSQIKNLKIPSKQMKLIIHKIQIIESYNHQKMPNNYHSSFLHLFMGQNELHSP